MGQRADAASAAMEAGPAVVRVARSFRVLGLVVLGGLGAGIASSVVSAVAAGDPGAPFGRQGWSGHVVAGWVVSLSMLLVMALSLAALLTYRTTWSADGVATRLLFLRWGVPVGEVAAVRLEPARTRSATGPRPAALQVLDRVGRVGAVLRPTEESWSAGLAVVRSWAAARPDLVADDATATLLGVRRTA